MLSLQGSGSKPVTTRPPPRPAGRFARSLALMMFCSAAIASSATAQAAPGVLLVSELRAGSVVAVQEGGDLTGASRFATGLDGPGGLCVGPNNDIFLAEVGTNSVRIITAGGDFSTGDAFATIPSPIALACSSTSVYVSVALGELEITSSIVDISSGGDFTSATPFATVEDIIFTLSFDGDGKLWAGGQAGVWDISAGGAFDSTNRYATDDIAILVGFGMVDTELYVGRSEGNVVAVTMGATLDTAAAFATVPNLIGFTASDGHAFATAHDLETDASSVFDISAGGDFAAASPLATGLSASDFAGMLYMRPCGDGAAQEAFGEECDDGDDNSDTTPDACRTNCRPASCGDAIVDTGEDCDEGDANDDSGACHTDCRCADADSDGICDDEDDNDGSETCQPAPVLLETTTLTAGDAACPQGGMRSTAGADDGDPSGTACDGVLQPGEVDSMESVCSTEVPTEDKDDDGDGDDGCSVHATGEGQSGLAASIMMVLAIAWLRRRRACARLG
jgi:MYXO-CTERM domain-containing protein